MQIPVATVTEITRALTHCRRRSIDEPKPAGRSAQVIVGTFADTYLRYLVEGRPAPEHLTADGFILWNGKTPNIYAANKQAKNAAGMLHDRLGGLLKGAKPEVEVEAGSLYSASTAGDKVTGRIDWLTTDNVPVEIKVSDNRDPAWLLQVACYADMVGATEAVLAVASNADKGICEVTQWRLDRGRIDMLMNRSELTYELQALTNNYELPGHECRKCTVDECIFNLNKGGE